MKVKLLFIKIWVEFRKTIKNMIIDFRTVFPKYNINPKGVMHVGANIGEEFPIYMELGIRKQLWFEANPSIYKKLVQNISSNPEAIAYNLCVGNEAKKVILHESNNAGQSSSVLEFGTHKIAHPEVHYINDIEVEMIRLKDYEFSSDFDFFNADIQGLELEALKGLGDKINQFNWLYLEVNKEPLYIGCALVEDIDEYVAQFGFKRVETIWCGNTGWGDSLFVK